MAQNTKKQGGKEMFPSHGDPTKMKNTLEWGMRVANAVEGQWFARESNSSKFYINRNRFHTMRLYAKGDQDIRRYKDEFSVNGDLSYLNLDWTPVPIVPKFVDIVVNGMQDRDFTVMAQAVDPVASAQRKGYQETLMSEMKNKDALMKVQGITGADAFQGNPADVPSTEDELKIHMELDYKQGVETAMESAINYELKINEFDNIKYRFDYDLATVGIGAVKHQFIPGEGIKIQYVDPANLVYSETESRFYDDCYYFGELRRIHITDLQVQFPWLTPGQIEMLEKKGDDTADNYNGTTYNQERQERGYVDVLFGCYKTVHNEIYKIKESTLGTPKALTKDENFNPPKDSRTGFEKTSRSNEVIYEFVKVVGEDILLKWELQKNMVRPSLQSPKVIMPYIVASPKQYKGKIYSLVRRMEKYADAIQLINLKIQQVIQKMTPSGIFLDVDGLAEIDLGNGTSYNAQTAIDMYMQTGTVVGRSMTDDGEFNHGKVPIQELAGSGGQQIQVLLTAYEYNLNQIRNVTGLNEARDGSTPDPYSLVGVQKLAALNSNTATRHILKSGEYIKTRLAEGLALRINDVLMHSPSKKDYISAIGKYNVNILEDLGKMSAHEYGIFLNLGPDEEEMAKLDAIIQGSIARGELKTEDAMDVMQIPNLRLASQVLKLRRSQREQIEQLNQQNNIDRQNQGLAAVAQQTEQAKAQMEQAKAQAQIEVDNNKGQLDMAKLEREAQLEIEILQMKAQLEAQAQGMQMAHEDDQNKKKMKGDMDKEKAKTGFGPVSVSNNANTVDGKTKSGGIL